MEHVIFLHGALGSSEQMQPLIEKFKFKYPEYSCHSFDLYGHGKKAELDNNENEFSIQQFSNDLLNYTNSIDKEIINIFGYSMGGYAALCLAKNNPGVINRIFTLGTKFDWGKETAEKEASMLDADKIEEKIPKFAEVLKARHGEEGWKTVLVNTASMMNALGDHPLLKTDDLNKIKCKVKITVGDKDNMVSVEESKKAAEDLKNGSFLLLQNTLHPIEKVDPDMLCNELNNFFNS